MNRMSIASSHLSRSASSLQAKAWSICLLVLLVSSVGIGRAELLQEEEAATESGTAEAETGPETAADSEKPLANTLKWSTASEVDNFGYDVFRGDQEEGPFERITDDPIPGAGTTDEPSSYEFADSNIDPSRAYFYYVESIALDGTRERFTPVIRAKAKRPVEGEENLAESPDAPNASETSESSGTSEASGASEPDADPTSGETGGDPSGDPFGDGL